MRMLMQRDQRSRAALHDQLHRDDDSSTQERAGLSNLNPKPEEIAFMSDDYERERILKRMIAACWDEPDESEGKPPAMPWRVEDRLLAAGEKTKQKVEALRCAKDDEQSHSLNKGPTINHRSAMLVRTGRVEETLQAKKNQYQARRENAMESTLRS